MKKTDARRAVLDLRAGVLIANELRSSLTTATGARVLAAAVSATVSFATLAGTALAVLGLDIAFRLLEQSLARKANLSIAVHFEHLHLHDVAHLELFLDALQTAVRNLGNVQQPVLAGKNLHERTEGENAAHFPFVRLAHFGLGRDLADTRERDLRTLRVDRDDAHGSVVFDLDLGAGLFLDALHNLASRSDDLADLVGRDGDGGDLRSVRRDIRLRLGDGL